MKKFYFVGTSPYKFRSSTPPPRGNDAVQVLKLVLISLRAYRYFCCSDSNSKSIFYCQLTALEFMRSYSQKKFMEE